MSPLPLSIVKCHSLSVTSSKEDKFFSKWGQCLQASDERKKYIVHTHSLTYQKHSQGQPFRFQEDNSLTNQKHSYCWPISLQDGSKDQNSTNTKSLLTLRSICFLFPWEYINTSRQQNEFPRHCFCLHFSFTLQTDFICFIGIICMFILLRTMHSNFRTLYIFSQI